MKNIKLLLFILFIFECSKGQLPDTDIFIANMSRSDSTLSFSQAVNMTRRKGYDNQPFFTNDGLSFYFVSINKDTTQSDVYKCDMLNKKISRFTATPTSEYSPQLSPDGKRMGVVRVDADSGQRFYTIPLEDPRIAIHADHSDSIGYFTWMTDSTIAMFVLGKTNSLQLLNISSGERRFIAPSIGRCLKMNAEKTHLYFVSKESDTILMRMRLSDLQVEKVHPTLSGTEDFALLSDNSILMGREGMLYRRKSSSSNWEMVADFKPSLSDFYRISVAPTGDRIAIVAYTGIKP
jgi:hypothetical protein